jgi:hypothetical protein
VERAVMLMAALLGCRALATRATSCVMTARAGGSATTTPPGFSSAFSTFSVHTLFFAGRVCYCTSVRFPFWLLVRKVGLARKTL